MRSPVLIIAFVSALRICGQSGGPLELRFQQLTTDDGLSDNAITCVFEDRTGYIWIGTEHGLNRYNGDHIEHFGEPDARMRNARITSIIQDSQGIFWIATQDDGLARYAPALDQWHWWKHDPKDPSTLPCDRLTCLFDLDDSTLMIGGSPIAVAFMNKRTFALTQWKPLLRTGFSGNVNGSNGFGWCHAITPLPNGQVWIGLLHNNSSVIMDRKYRVVQLLRSGDPAFDHTLSRAQPIGDVLYTGGWQNDVERYVMRTWQPLPAIRTTDETTCLAKMNGLLLIGMKRSGLLLHDPQDGSMTALRHRRSDPSSLANDQVRCALIDRTGNAWIGTANGLSMHASSVWRMDETNLFGDRTANQPDLELYAIEQDAAGTVRAYTSNGFFLLAQGSQRFTQEPVIVDGQRLRPTRRSPIAGSEYLMGTETGLVRCDARTGRALSPFVRLQSGSVLGGVEDMYQVRGVFPDTLKGVPVWVTCALGFGTVAYRADNGNAWPSALGDLLMLHKDAAMARDMRRDAHGNYWWASDGGVVSWRPKTDHYDLFAEGKGPNYLPGSHAAGLLIDGDSVRVTMREGGLVSIANGHVVRHPLADGRSTVMLGLTKDHGGRIWITTEDGLERFDPTNGNFLHVDVNDGRSFRKLTTAITTLRDGRIAFLADNTLITFRPDAYDQPPAPPDPYVYALNIAGHELQVPERERSVSLSYRRSTLDIGVSALRPVSPRPLEFLYKLEGVEKDWRVTSGREPIRFVGMPVGTHRLLVKVRDAFGHTGPVHALIAIDVIAPFWLKWWFYTILLTVIAIALWAFFRFRLRQQLRLQRVRDRIARDLHDDIGSTLGSISYYSAAVKQRIEQNDPQGAQEVLERIGQNSREMIDQMYDIVWSVDPSKDAFGELSTRMRSFASELLGPLGVSVILEEDPALAHVTLSMEQRKGLFLLFKEAVFNAAKHAQANTLSIALRREGRDLSIVISDDGTGLATANGSAMGGNGLENMRRRATDLGGVCTIVGGHGAGTQVMVRVPLHAPIPASGD